MPAVVNMIMNLWVP